MGIKWQQFSSLLQHSPRYSFFIIIMNFHINNIYLLLLEIMWQKILRRLPVIWLPELSYILLLWIFIPIMSFFRFLLEIKWQSHLNIPALSSVIFIIIIIMNFHTNKIDCRLSDTPLSILDIFSNASVWMVLTLLIFSGSSRIFTWHFGTVPKTPITTGMTVIFILIIIYLFCLFICITVKMYCRSKCSIFKILGLSEQESVKLFQWETCIITKQ